MSRREEETLQEIGQTAVAAREQAEGSSVGGTDEFAVMLGKIHYLYKDDEVLELMEMNDRLKQLRPAISHLTRTTRIVDDKTIRLLKLRWRRALRLQLLVLGGRNDVRSQAIFDAWLNYGYAAIEDTRKGWRGKLCTETIRKYEISGAEKQRKKILGIF